LLLFVVAVAALVVVAILPERELELPDQEIQLRDASVRLYPRADREAVWSFSAPAASYDADDGTAVLREIEDGRREVGGELDFTVASQELLIDRQDNLVGEQIFAYLVETGECLSMHGSQANPVIINQERAQFDVPVLEISGPSWGEGTRLEQMRVSFDLEDAEGGGAGTTTTAVFRVGEAQDELRRTVCETS